MVDPEEIVGQGILNRRTQKHALERMAIERGIQLLQGAEPVYLIIGRDSHERLGDLIGEHSDVIATVHDTTEPARHDWLIVTNASRIAGRG
jgi:hypothetical protein